MKQVSFGRIFRRHYIPGLVLGVITLAMTDALLAPEVISGFETLSQYALAGLLSGGTASMITVLFHISRNRRVLKKRTILFHHVSSSREIMLAAISTFISGGACILLFLSPYLSMGLCIVTLTLVIFELRLFAKELLALLTPGTYPTWENVGQIVDAYITMIAAFTITNINLAAFHRLVTSTPEAFSLGGAPTLADFIYFSVVVITTLGFGDIHPVTSDAKLLVSFECLVGYVMFALIVGVITRGIVSGTKTDTQVSVSVENDDADTNGEVN
ncbi:potassium channel family protein [Desulfovibrio inopinatus]|uniref:potassium channel family protein n=1 Tax=Desulfovibrio inopinatus TaxID=102109 RepID=UPI000400BB76|nr:potassium channel family protein [Desulfovibrio inopinatus]